MKYKFKHKIRLNFLLYLVWHMSDKYIPRVLYRKWYRTIYIITTLEKVHRFNYSPPVLVTKGVLPLVMWTFPISLNGLLRNIRCSVKKENFLTITHYWEFTIQPLFIAQFKIFTMQILLFKFFQWIKLLTRKMYVEKLKFISIPC